MVVFLIKVAATQDLYHDLGVRYFSSMGLKPGDKARRHTNGTRTLHGGGDDFADNKVMEWRITLRKKRASTFAGG